MIFEDEVREFASNEFRDADAKNRRFAKIMCLFVVCFVVAWVGLFIISTSSAITPDDITPTQTPIFISVNQTTQTELLNHTYEIHRISQGDTVYLGDHIDISGVVAGNKALVWFAAGEPDPAETPYVIPLPETKAGFYDFYVNPDIFLQMTGWVYKWNGYYESNGNTRAFYVKAMFRNETLTFSNGTVINQSELLSGNYTNQTIPKPPLLEERRVADYLITQGDALNITVNKTSALWIFNGADNSVVYSRDGNQTEIVVNETTIGRLPVGRYEILIQSISNRTPNLDVQYAGNNTVKWFDRNLFAVHELSLNGMTPDNAIANLEQIFPQTFDTYEKYVLVVQRPDITIESMDKVGVWAAKEYYKLDDKRGNVSLMDVRGYTNALPGTPVSVVLDLDHTTPRDVGYSTFNTTAVGDFRGNKRMYQVYVPLYEDSLYIGMHSLTASTAIGGVVRSDFPVTIMPPDSYQDNVTVKWVGNTSPWVPPVTVTVTIPIPVPGPTQYIPVTPSNEQVYAQQLKAQQDLAEKSNANFNEFVFWTLITVIAWAIISYIGYVIYRRKKDAT